MAFIYSIFGSKGVTLAIGEWWSTQVINIVARVTCLIVAIYGPTGLQSDISGHSD